MLPQLFNVIRGRHKQLDRGPALQLNSATTLLKHQTALLLCYLAGLSGAARADRDFWNAHGNAHSRHTSAILVSPCATQVGNCGGSLELPCRYCDNRKRKR
jgi:hypothetical protein